TYWGDLRMPATMVGHVMSNLGTGTLPYAALVNSWSEPPYATIGLGTGTMASYCRPYQHLAYYEIDDQIRNFSLPPRGQKAFFTYLLGSIRRGGNVEVVMGDARLSMERPQRLAGEERSPFTLFPVLPTDYRVGTSGDDSDHASLPQSTMSPHREKYYK